MKIYKLFLPLIFVVAIMLSGCANKQDFILHSYKVKVYEHDENQSVSAADPKTGKHLGYIYDTVLHYEFTLESTRDMGSVEEIDKMIYLAIEPTDRLLSLLKGNPFANQKIGSLDNFKYDGVLYRCSYIGPTRVAAGEKLEYKMEFIIGTRDEAGTENPDKLVHPPTPEEAREIEKESCNAKLLIKQGEKIIQVFPLSDYN